jgi:hypothetical protein
MSRRFAITPSSPPPTDLIQRSTVATDSVVGDSCTRAPFGTARFTNCSSATRRSSSGSFTSDRPRASTSRSKTISEAGLVRASVSTRDFAGWMRRSRSSKESTPSTGTTISPSSRNCLAFSPSNVSTRSGKYRASGFPAFDIRSTFAPSRKARQRNPSHFGSYRHSLPSGSSSTSFASMGA